MPHASSSSSDSDDDGIAKSKPFDHQRPMRELLGGGKVADVLLWKDKALSAAILIGIGALWYLFEVIGYNFLTLLCLTIIFAMVIIFVWDKVADIFKCEVMDQSDGAVSVPSTQPTSSEWTLGRHLALRLVEIGATDVFSVSGDFNVKLLDQLIAEPRLRVIGCCNELNAAYAADGFARSQGVGVCVVTFTVGGLSMINAVAGAYSEDLPVICIVGGPNSNDYGTHRILHHTIGSPDFSQEMRCFQPVTCYQAVVNDLDHAHEQIDTAISTALKESKPVYISVSCNLPAISHPAFSRKPVPFSPSPREGLETDLTFSNMHKVAALRIPLKQWPPISVLLQNHAPKSKPNGIREGGLETQFNFYAHYHASFIDSLEYRLSNPAGLEAAVQLAAEFLNKAKKPVLVGGPKLRVAKACGALEQLANACGYALATLPSAKGLVPEHHPHFIGTYWGAVSTPFCEEIVESADAYLFAGPVFNDYSSVGYTLRLKREKAIIVQPDRVVFANGPAFGCVLMKDFLSALAEKLNRNTTAYENYHKKSVTDGDLHNCGSNKASMVNVTFQHIQKMLSSDTVVIVETGDSWFNCQKLKLPEGSGYEFQMQYGSVGWSIGATLGYAQAANNKRVIACIGDGSFQVALQDVSTMMGCGQRSIIFLINNGAYTIASGIQEGPYNVIKNWNYTGLVDAIDDGEGKCWTTKVRCEEELIEAIAMATGEKKDCLCFIEVRIQKNDKSKELLVWGPRVSAANNRPPAEPSENLI